MDFQVLTFFILAMLTVALIALIIYIITVLRELKTTIQRLNDILGNVHMFTGSFSNPIGTVATVIKSIVKTVKEIRKDL